jgi:chromosome segregation ATPase
MDELLKETRETLAQNAKLKKELSEIAGEISESLTKKGPTAATLQKLKSEKEQNAILLEQNISLKSEIAEFESSMQDLLAKYRADAELCEQARRAAKTALEDLQDARSQLAMAEESLAHTFRELNNTRTHNDKLVRELNQAKIDCESAIEKEQTTRRELGEKLRLMQGSESQQIEDRKEVIRISAIFEQMSSKRVAHSVR